MSGALTMSSAAVNAEHEALLEGELSLHCLDFKPASTEEAFHEAAVYVFLGEENARRLAACWNACHGVSTEHLERSAAPPAAAHGDEAVDQLARKLFAAFAKAEPGHPIALNPASYWATFADMARAAMRAQGDGEDKS